MKTRHFLAAVVLAGSAAITGGCSGLIPSGGGSVTKTQWMKVLPVTMSDELCDGGGALRQCYPVSEDDCRAQVRTLTVSCESHYKSRIPSRMGEQDTIDWGERIGSCTGRWMFERMRTKYRQRPSEACQQALARM